MPIDCVLVKEKGRYVPIPLSVIQYISVEDNYCKLHAGRYTRRVYINLGALQERLPKTLFLRIHRKFLVNIKHVTSISRNSVSIGGDQLPVSRNLSPHVLVVFAGNTMVSRH
ncbi:LytR/AlgR family response regulator transcription factor [Flavihumibacter petaseus]|uniref:LytR/AlgR family response regulator transcription factor n=1 Tax=Flavihumibacter petaseus TaxID=549295 RepID=UPI00090802A5|nr:LytTR family DNA-binding domain-containing protein [Flavihumibacter petaseus]